MDGLFSIHCHAPVQQRLLIFKNVQKRKSISSTIRLILSYLVSFSRQAVGLSAGGKNIIIPVVNCKLNSQNRNLVSNVAKN